MTHPQDTPANPAQVTDAWFGKALKRINERLLELDEAAPDDPDKCPENAEFNIEDVRTLTAAIGAGRQAVGNATALAEKDARIGELEAAVAVQRESKEYAQRCCVTAESALTASRAEREGLQAALNQIDALDPEDHIYGVSHDACRGLIIRMGEIARAALSQKGPGDAT